MMENYLEANTRSVQLKFLLSLFIIVLVKAALIYFIILNAGINLNVEEAQYWNWSRALDWGYYSKPPGIAYETHLGTLLFGNTELGVRFVPLVVGTIFPFVIYTLGWAAGLKARGSFYAAIIFAFSFAGVLSSFIATTDGLFVFFWALACIPIVYGLTHQTRPHYYLTALLIVMGAQFKWHIYELWLVIFVFAAYYRFIRSWHLLSAFFLSFVGLLPSVVWNAQHDWSTFKHVWKTNIPHPMSTAAHHGNFWEFLGAQVVLLSPVFFIVFLLAIVWLMRNRFKTSPGILFCVWTSLFILGGFLTFSLFSKMQGNWGVYVYPTVAIVTAWYIVEKTQYQKTLMTLGVTVAVLLSGLVFSLPYIQSRDLFPQVPIPFKSNMFKEFLGWESLSRVLKDKGYDPSSDFLVSDRYQITSVLGFYTEGQKRAYFLNLQGLRRNQFSYWPSLADEKRGKQGFFVLQSDKTEDGQKYLQLLKNYFTQVDYLGYEPIYEAYGKVVKAVHIFRVVGYNGTEPPSVDKF